MYPSSRAGKSSLTVQFVDGAFVDSYYPTIEGTFQKTVKYKSQEFQLDIIDTAGQVSATLRRVFPRPAQPWLTPPPSPLAPRPAPPVAG